MLRVSMGKASICKTIMLAKCPEIGPIASIDKKGMLAWKMKVPRDGLKAVSQGRWLLPLKIAAPLRKRGLLRDGA
jgi:hypothetical protein